MNYLYFTDVDDFEDADKTSKFITFNYYSDDTESKLKSDSEDSEELDSPDFTRSPRSSCLIETLTHVVSDKIEQERELSLLRSECFTEKMLGSHYQPTNIFGDQSHENPEAQEGDDKMRECHKRMISSNAGSGETNSTDQRV